MTVVPAASGSRCAPPPTVPPRWPGQLVVRVRSAHRKRSPAVDPAGPGFARANRINNLERFLPFLIPKSHLGSPCGANPTGDLCKSRLAIPPGLLPRLPTSGHPRHFVANPRCKELATHKASTKNNNEHRNTESLPAISSRMSPTRDPSRHHYSGEGEGEEEVSVEELPFLT